MSQRLPVFIGNFRSGTTLVANLLGFHDDVAPWFETKAFCEPLRWLRVLEQPGALGFEGALIQSREWPGFTPESVAYRMLDDFRQTDARLRGEIYSGKGEHEYYPLGHDLVAYRLSDAEAAVDRWLEQVSSQPVVSVIRRATGELISHLGDLHARLSARSIWINKTPEIPRFGHELRGCLGPCRVVMMMRDCEDVVRSAVNLGWAEADKIAFWCRGMVDESRMAARKDPQNYLELDYEGLLREPVATINELLGFIGVSQVGEVLLERYEASLPPSGRSLRGAFRGQGRTHG